MFRETSWTIENINLSQPLYWSVEAVNNAFGRSGFAPERILSPLPGNSLFSDAGFTFPGIGVGSLEWGDFDNDGDLDVLANGEQQAGGNASTLLFRNNGSSFSQISPVPFSNLKEIGAKFIDFDNDNDLDVFVMGQNTSNTPLLILYQNMGNSSLFRAQLRIYGLYPRTGCR
ncbi:MAG: VCBS repeat-containing protein [Bacteroidia bacterium]